MRPVRAIRPALGLAATLLALPALAAPAAKTIHPTEAPAIRALHETGTAKAARSVELVARVSGALERIEYQDGQEVEAGALLFVIEQAPYRVALAQAQAQVAQAEAVLADAELTLERDLKLSARAVAQAQVDGARARRDQAKAQLAAAEAQREQSRINLGYTEIRAPFAGHVGAHRADVGALVGPGGVTSLATIVQMDPVKVDFEVADRDVLRLRAGVRERGLTWADLPSIAVEAGTQADVGFPIRGHLDYIAPQTNAATGTLSARAVFDNADRALLPGLFVRLRIPLAVVEKALHLPDAAIGTDQGGAYVLVVGPDGVVARREVTLGARGEAGQEVTGDLSAADRVLANALAGPRPGDVARAED